MDPAKKIAVRCYRLIENRISLIMLWYNNLKCHSRHALSSSGGGSESRWPRHANKIPRIITRMRNAFDRRSRASAQHSRRPSPLTSGDVRQSFREATFHPIPRLDQRFSYRHSRLTALEKTLLARIGRAAVGHEEERERDEGRTREEVR